MLKKSVFIPVFLFLIFNFGFWKVSAHDVKYHAIGQSSDDDDTDDLKKKIKEYEKKIKDLQGKEKTLQNQISSLDDQINLILLKIQEANKNILLRESELKSLEESIGEIGERIEKLRIAMNYQSLLFNERIKSRYKLETISPLEYFFNLDVNDFVLKAQYIKVIEKNDKRLINQLKDTKTNYEIQKTTLEEKKTKVEEVKKKIEIERANLEGYNASLSVQKREKDSLLAQTRGDEATYQELLSKAKAELDAIEGAVKSVNFANGSKVDKGDVIAVMGNSGYPNCSTGAHLHFEVRKNGSVVNAESYLKSKSVYVDDYSSGYKTIGSGKWEWPMKNAEVTQRYGKTPWSWRYSGGKHTGIDMVSSNTYIYAPDDGRIVKGTAGCYGSSMNYAAIEHGGGVISYYFHIR